MPSLSNLGSKTVKKRPNRITNNGDMVETAKCPMIERKRDGVSL